MEEKAQLELRGIQALRLEPVMQHVAHAALAPAAALTRDFTKELKHVAISHSAWPARSAAATLIILAIWRSHEGTEARGDLSLCLACAERCRYAHYPCDL